MASQQELPAGATIYEAGDVSKGAYLIQSGKVDLMTAENFRLVTLGAGEMFGELGLVIDDFRRRDRRNAHRMRADFNSQRNA